MLYLMCLVAIAFNDDHIAYPWSYATFLALVHGGILVFTGTSLQHAGIAAGGVFLYVGVVFWFLSRQMRYSIGWWLAMILALGPELFMRFTVKH